MFFQGFFHFKNKQSLFVIATWFLLLRLISPPLLAGQPAYRRADSLHAEDLLRQGVALRDSAVYVRSNAILATSAKLFQKSGLLYKAARCYNYISLNFLATNKTDSAEVYALKALEIVNKQKFEDPTERVRAYNNMALAERLRGHYNQSMDWLQTALRLVNVRRPRVEPSLEFLVLRSIGSAYDDLGKYDEALAYYYKALDLLNIIKESVKKKRARLYNNIGYTYSNKGLYMQAREFYEKELKLNLELSGEWHPDVATAYVNVGAALWRQGDYGQALLYFQKSLKVTLEVYGEEHEATIVNYENIALCYVKAGDFGKAIAGLKRALKIKKRVFGTTHPGLGVSYKNIGEIYFMQDKYDQALSYYKKALAIQLNGLGSQHPDLVATYNKIASVFTKQNLPDSAFIYLDKAQSVGRKALGSDHPALAYMYAAMAQAGAKNNRPRQTISYYQQALRILADDFDTAMIFDNPGISDIQYPLYAIDILLGKAKMLHSLYADGGDADYLRASLSTFEVLSKLLDNLQADLVNIQSKLANGRQSHTIYEHAIQVAYDLYQLEKNPFYLKRIFYYAEKSKARIMLETLAAHGAERYTSIPDSMLDHQHFLKEKIHSIRQRVNLIVDRTSASSDRLAMLRDSLLALNKQLARHTKMLGTRYPRYHTLKYANHIPSIEEVQHQLQERDFIIVEYFLGDESLFAIIMTANRLVVQKLPFDAQLTNHIREFKRAITQRDDSSYYELGFRLYQTLIEPITTYLSSSKQMLIVPGRELALLPFEALLTRPGPASASTGNYRNLPYLLWEYETAYAPSVALSTFSRTQEDHPYNVDLLAFAPAFTAGPPVWPEQTEIISRSAWNPLPFSRREVVRIASLFDQQLSFWDYLFGSDRTKLFMDRRASEEALKAKPVLDAQYIHLATHAFISQDRSELAGILLYPGESRKEDGILFTGEIYNLSMNADLVVLSACETGRGSVVKGEGIMSLSRAFRYAGAKNLLVSLWKVGDRSSARLMVELYQRLINGKNKTRALYEAKKNLIEETKYAHPLYWAPFILIGQ